MLHAFPADLVLSVLMSTNLVVFNLKNGGKPCILYPPYGGRGIEFLTAKNGGKPWPPWWLFLSDVKGASRPLHHQRAQCCLAIG